MSLEKVSETAGQKKFIKKITYWALGVLIVVVALVTFIPETKKPEETKPSNQNIAENDKNVDFTINSTAYINEYVEDKVAAENKYFGRNIIITGTVKSLGQTQDQYNQIYLQDKGSYRIACVIRDNQDKSSIKPGMNIKLLGISHGADNNILKIVNCKVLD
jgi:hypothetical protein